MNRLTPGLGDLRHFAFFVLARRLAGDAAKVQMQMGLVVKAGLLRHAGEVTGRVLTEDKTRQPHLQH